MYLYTRRKLITHNTESVFTSVFQLLSAMLKYLVLAVCASVALGQSWYDDDEYLRLGGGGFHGGAQFADIGGHAFGNGYGSFGMAPAYTKGAGFGMIDGYGGMALGAGVGGGNRFGFGMPSVSAYGHGALSLGGGFTKASRFPRRFAMARNYGSNLAVPFGYGMAPSIGFGLAPPKFGRYLFINKIAMFPKY